VPETATIRVDREVRDQLARVAEGQGISLAGLLRRYAREQAIASERAATLRDRTVPEAVAEQDDWDFTVGDGID
jgi:predicted transcriptional regulator